MKKLILTSLSTVAVSFSACLSAQQCLSPTDLQITNNTPLVSTAKVIGANKRSICTGISFLENGKTRPGQSKCFDQNFTGMICGENAEHCTAIVYLYDEAKNEPLCSKSTEVAQVIFSVTKGIDSANIINNPNSEYQVIGNGFHMTVVHK